MVERLLATVARSREVELISVRAWARRLVSELALQDWLVLIYFAVLIGAVAIFGAPGETRNQILIQLGALTAVLVTALVAVRGSLLTRPLAVSLAYRLSIFGVVQTSYFLLKGLLPLVSDRALDTQLYHLDLAMFGFEPSLVMDRFVNLYTTEWFAFFYYSYFFVLALHVLPFMFLSRSMKLFGEFTIGMISVYCIAHTVYMLVPGYGPYRFLAGQFQHPLAVGFWMDRVLEAVNGAGAQKDIFPSLHTAGPLFILLFSFRNRDKFPFKYTWPITGFVVVNIMLATMFLRWHYLIDIVAGVALAATACYFGSWLSARECKRRELAGLQPVWAPLLPERTANGQVEPTSAAALHSARQ
jgi:hypothetical protein